MLSAPILTYLVYAAFRCAKITSFWPNCKLTLGVQILSLILRFIFKDSIYNQKAIYFNKANRYVPIS